MVKGIKTIYSCGLNKVFRSRLCIGSTDRQETPEGDRRTYWAKCCELTCEDEYNNPNILSDKYFKVFFEYGLT